MTNLPKSSYKSLKSIIKSKSINKVSINHSLCTSSNTNYYQLTQSYIQNQTPTSYKCFHQKIYSTQFAKSEESKNLMKKYDQDGEEDFIDDKQVYFGIGEPDYANFEMQKTELIEKTFGLEFDKLLAPKEQPLDQDAAERMVTGALTSAYAFKQDPNPYEKSEVQKEIESLNELDKKSTAVDVPSPNRMKLLNSDFLFDYDEEFYNKTAPEVKKEVVEEVIKMPFMVKPVCIIDIRDPEKFLQKRIPQTNNIPLFELSRGALMMSEVSFYQHYRFLKPTRDSIIILLGDDPHESEIGGFIFNMEGYPTTFNYRGGIKDWFSETYQTIYTQRQNEPVDEFGLMDEEDTTGIELTPDELKQLEDQQAKQNN